MGSQTGMESDSPDDVRIRRYAPDDRADVLELDETVWDRTMDESWFAWKYERNPYLSEPPVFIAEADDMVVGARPFMGFRLKVGESIVCALQPSDTMVHPEYRGRGIFTRMTEKALSYYAERPPELCFNFPNEMSLPGYRKLGWRVVGEGTTSYRLQHPRALGFANPDGRAERLVSRLMSPTVRTIQAFWTRFSPSPEEFTVERKPEVPARTLTDLYGRRVPPHIHAHRDEAFYRWRFASPAWRRCAYVARRNGSDVAGIIVRTRTTAEEVTVTQIADVVPLVGGDQWTAALACLLGRVVADYPHSDVIATYEAPFPRDLLAAFGFLPDDRPPVTWCTEHDSTFAVRPLGDLDEASWTLNGYCIADSTNWIISLSETDTA